MRTLTVFEIGNHLKDVAVGVERLGPTNATVRAFPCVQDDLSVGEVPGGNSLVQGLAKSRSSRHVGRNWLQKERRRSRAIFIRPGARKSANG